MRTIKDRFPLTYDQEQELTGCLNELALWHSTNCLGFGSDHTHIDAKCSVRMKQHYHTCAFIFLPGRKDCLISVQNRHPPTFHLWTLLKKKWKSGSNLSIISSVRTRHTNMHPLSQHMKIIVPLAINMASVSRVAIHIQVPKSLVLHELHFPPNLPC